MTELPDPIRELALHGLKQMRTHPAHHYDWRVRREIYGLMHVGGDPVGWRAHGWAAVLSAERVLPIVTARFPDDKLPVRLVRYARRVLAGTISPGSWRVEILEDDGYTCTGVDNILSDVRGGVVDYRAEHAGNAAYKALVEARGTHELLESVETLRRRNGSLVMGATTGPKFDGYERGDTFTDADIAHLAAFSDTASTAAFASACAVEDEQLDPARLREFWEWWALEALPEAWRRSVELSPPYTHPETG